MLLSCKLEVNGTLCALALEVEGTLCALPKKNPSNHTHSRDQEEDGEVGGGAIHKAHGVSNLSSSSENVEILTYIYTLLLQLPHMFPPMEMTHFIDIERRKVMLGICASLLRPSSSGVNQSPLQCSGGQVLYRIIILTRFFKNYLIHSYLFVLHL